MTPTRSTGDSTNWFPIRKSCGWWNSTRTTRLLQARCGSPGTSRKPAEEPKSRCSARASRQESGPRTTKRALFLPYGNWLRSWSRTASWLHQRSDRRGLWPHRNRLRLWNEPQNGHRHLSVIARLRLSQNRAALLGDGPAGIEGMTQRILFNRLEAARNESRTRDRDVQSRVDSLDGLVGSRGSTPCRSVHYFDHCHRHHDRRRQNRHPSEVSSPR